MPEPGARVWEYEIRARRCDSTPSLPANPKVPRAPRLKHIFRQRSPRFATQNRDDRPLRGLFQPHEQFGMPSFFGNASEPVGGWRPEPLQRGTWSILSSCIITMTLCVWTSVHLNIPEHGKAHLQKYWKVCWLLIALFAPEFVGDFMAELCECSKLTLI
jgi:hypothetical protein